MVMSKTAIVTGASRGIGLGIATRLAERGYGLTISARDPERLKDIANRLCLIGSADVTSVAGDMADPGIAARVAAAHREKFESVDALILNAGVGTAGRIDSFPMRRFDKTVAVNLRAPLALLQATLPLLRRAAADKPDNGAKVIALSSITGVHGQPDLAVYGATKAALISLVETFNAEESGAGVSATAIAPGYVDTDMAAWTHDSIPADTMIKVGDIIEIVDMLLRISAAAVVPSMVISRAGTDGWRA
jgi:short-subunit dehydrogenase